MSQIKKQNITALILVHNEEIHLERCIKNLIKNVKKIIVIDSFSKDKSINICQKYKIKFFKRKFIDHSTQLNWALKKIDFKTNWILRIDADEIVEKNFFNKFNKIKNKKKYNGIDLNIDHIFLGDKINYGGVYPQNQIRIWKKNKGYFDKSPMDEKIIIHKKLIYKSNLKIIDFNLKGLKFWVKKHYRYANKEAEFYNILVNNKFKTNQNIKNKILYYKFPIFLRVFLLFLYRYIIKKGFLDGYVGLKFSLLHTFYYRLIIDFLILKRLIVK